MDTAEKTGENLGMDRPLLVAMDGRGLTDEELEAGFLEEALELTERWATRLPASSRWSPTCVLWRQIARRGLGRREARLAALP